MPAPSTTDEFLALVAKSELLPIARLEEFLDAKRAAQTLPVGSLKMAQLLVQDGLLTKYQAEQLLGGRWRNFIIGGKYKLLERLGKGGMALVFLCEHQVMKRLVALKILPTTHAEDKELLGRFHREARALSSLRHPNIVGAYDADYASKVYFLVMEYVDGGDLDQIVQKAGPLPWNRAAHYIRQAALGLQHAHECGLVHRDIKPGNVLVDRTGIVKLLDLGLARIFHETTDDLTTGRDAKTLLGTVDYLAPEQALNSHNVDIRADIYSLGATFYYLLTGKGLFEDGTVAQKLSWHLHRPPVPISEARPDVPEELVWVIEQMLAKHPDDRYQTPQEVYEALEPWTKTPVAPPTPDELPQLSPAARGIGPPSSALIAASASKNNAPSLTRNPNAISKATKILPDGALATLARTTTKPRLESTLRDIPSLPKSPAQVKSPPTMPRSVATPARRSRRLRPAMALVAGALAVVSGLFWAFTGPEFKQWVDTNLDKRPGSLVVSGPTTPPQSPLASNLGPPIDQKADVSITLDSPSTATSRRFASLHEAIQASKAGDRVVVRGSLLIESIGLSDVEGVPRDLTIEGVNTRAKDQPVRWRGPRNLDSGRSLLDVSGLEGFHLKGFLLDGQGRVAELARLSGRGAGSTLEDLRIQGATRAGIVIRGWIGEPSHPTTIHRVRFSTTAESEAAILFEGDPDRPSVASESIRVQDCRFVGPFQAALMVAGPVGGLEVENSRFSRSTDGLRYRRIATRDPIRIRLSNNTFNDLQRGIHFETTPPSATSQLVVSNNIFSNTSRLATLDKVSIEPSKIAAHWIWTEEGKKTPTVPPGTRQFRKTFDVTTLPDKVSLDISCDETFTVWLNGSELMKNPSPHYTQRVFSIDISGKLHEGRNVLAVQGTNRLDRLDPKFGTTAGLLAQITTPGGPRDAALVKTDESWKCSDQAPEGWNRLEFDDLSWTSARRWQEDGVVWPWRFAVWDSVVFAQLKPPLEPIQVSGSGNLRDYKSFEGYPGLDSERVVIQDGDLSKNPDDDVRFLRTPGNHPLATAGPGGSSVGALMEER